MPFYVRQGNIPPKRHTQHRDREGKLYHEQLVSRAGFSGIYTNMYHLRPPTRISGVGDFKPIKYESVTDQPHRNRHLETLKFKPSGNWISGRQLLAFNSDVALFTAAPKEQGEFLYRNGIGDELIFVHHGKGQLVSIFGNMPYGPGDYIVIPRGVMYRLTLEADDTRLLIMESAGMIDTPQRYRNDYGQLLEHSPYCERDIRIPEIQEPRDEEGEFLFLLKLGNGIQELTFAHHPFDIVGWDGFYYPWIFNIKDFMPIVGKVHQPPPVHQTFEAPGFVICSFCPRLFDFHELAIPTPYNHRNIDSDEVLYYVEGNFMSRKGVSEGSITIHPHGISHGPHPGRYEAAIGETKTEEYAVMLDTFKPLKIGRAALEIDDSKYPYSWME
ncbi:MAG: homogentisate 1,2-dioxygenase [bacterium]|nr:MAG: homogentisate 1,2-dioxygenase [bacterium]